MFPDNDGAVIETYFTNGTPEDETKVLRSTNLTVIIRKKWKSRKIWKYRKEEQNMKNELLTNSY